ncbi:MAG: response regulator [Acidobacteria bacterium]|nr:response regulator [Acidobacteriota bacterium]
MKPSILVVDDERSITDTLVAILNQNGFTASGAYNGLDAANQVRESCPDILLTDVVMPKMDGIQLAIGVRSACPATRIVLISGQAATADYLERARTQGYEFEFLPKPIEPEELLERLAQGERHNYGQTRPS